MRILTYNIHKGIGGIDRRYEIQRTIEILSHYEADIVLLQEVDHGARRSDFHHQSELIAKSLGFIHIAVGLNHKVFRGGAYGNVTLSRWPIDQIYNLDISLPIKKKRGALYTRILLPYQIPLHVYNIHLGLAHFERILQVRKVLSALEKQARISEHPLIIAGDSNDWREKLCRKVLEPNGFHDVSTWLHGKRERTFPAYAPMFALDRLYFRNIEPKRLIRNFHDHLPNASDHLPLIAEFSIDSIRMQSYPLQG